MTFGVETRLSTIVQGAVIYRPSVFEDNRGMLWTSFLSSHIKTHIPDDLVFVHDKFAVTHRNVLRGIHYDLKSWKLVTCVDGIVDQVIVDMRKESSTFRQWEKFELRGDEPTSVLLPPGVGNAFYVKSDSAVYHYKLAYLGDYVDAGEQHTVYWNDNELNIDWPTNKPILSIRDDNQT